MSRWNESQDLRKACISDLAYLVGVKNLSDDLTKLGYGSYKGFLNPDEGSRYEAIAFIDGRWRLIDGNGILHDNFEMPLEDFCDMVDAIADNYEHVK